MWGTSTQTRRDVIARLLTEADELIERSGPLRVLGIGRAAELEEPSTAAGAELRAFASADADATQHEMPHVVAMIDAAGTSTRSETERAMERSWEQLAAGGWLLIIEEVVPAPGRTTDREPPPISPDELEQAVARCSGGEAVLEHVEALRCADEDLHRHIALVCSKPAGFSDPVRERGFGASPGSSRPGDPS